MRWPKHPIRSLSARLLGPVMGTLTRVKTSEPAIALTFDDGPHPEYTPRVLDLLREHNAKATFFIVGQSAENHPGLIQRIKDEGHALANHTHTHRAMPRLSSRERRGEVRQCAAAIGPQPTRLFRPPFGSQSRASRFDLLRLGYQPVTWDIVPEDWLKQPPADLAQRIIAKARPGSIVLLHDAIIPRGPDSDSCLDRGYMIDALAIVLGELSPSLRFVTVPELLQLGRPVYRPWFDQPAA